MWSHNESLAVKRGYPLLNYYSYSKGDERIRLENLIVASTGNLYQDLSKKDIKELRIIAGKLRLPKIIEKPTAYTTEQHPFYEIKTEKVVWPEINIKSAMKGSKNLPESIRNALPIKPSKQCRWVGMIRRGVGYGKQKVDMLDQSAMKMFEDKEGRELVNQALGASFFGVKVGGQWPSQRSTFQQYADPVIDLDMRELLDAVYSRLHKIKLPYIFEGVVTEDILNVGTNPESFAGYATSLFIARTHRGSDSHTKPVAAHVFDRICEKKLVDKSLWTIGGRSRVQELKPGVVEELKSRVVLMPESVPKIIGMGVSNQLYRRLVAYNKFDPANEIGVGIDFMNNRYTKFSQVFDQCTNVLELDWSKYDTKVSKNLIIVSFAIIRSCYPDGEKYDNIFFYLLSGFLYKNVLIPGGHVYRLMKGIPSGSPFTTLVGCIANWISWAVVLKDMKVDNKVVCYGDDTLVGWKEKNFMETEYTEGWFKERLNRLPLIAKKLTFFDQRYTEILKDGPTLLKTWSYHGLPARRFSDFAEVLLYGGDMRKFHGFKAVIEKNEKLTGAFYNSPFNFEVIEFVKKYKRVLLRLFFSNMLPSSYADPKEMGRIYNKTTVSAQIGIRRFVLDQTVLSPSNKTVLPWLEKEYYHCNTFYASKALEDYFLKKGIKLKLDTFKNLKVRWHEWLMASHPEHNDTWSTITRLEAVSKYRKLNDAEVQKYEAAKTDYLIDYLINDDFSRRVFSY